MIKEEYLYMLINVTKLLKENKKRNPQTKRNLTIILYVYNIDILKVCKENTKVISNISIK